MSNENSDGVAINADLVAAYLIENPDFFEGRDDVLKTLSLAHRSGKAISLIEKQILVLRQENDSLSHENEMIRGFAIDNEDKLRKTQRLVLSLLECSSIEDVGIALQESLCEDFASDVISLRLIDPRAGDGNSYSLLTDKDLAVISPLLQTHLPTCGKLSLEQKAALFGEMARDVGSLAVAPLVNGETLGVLCLGSFDEDYFSSGDSTLFLSYTADVTSRVISRFITDGTPRS